MLLQLLNPITLHVLVVVFVATLFRSAFGFGEALIAVPLLALRIPLETAAPLAVLLSVTVAAVIVAQDWRKIHLRSAGALVVSTLFGIPLGLWLLIAVNEHAVKLVLAVIIMAFAGYSLVVLSRNRTTFELKSDKPVWILSCGFLAGVLGGAYGMNGPPLVIYGSLRRWSAQHFRATLQGYFLPASLIGMFSYWLAGLWVPAVTRYYLLSLPFALAATFLGRVINHRLHGRSFLAYIYIALLLVGATLFLQSIRS